MNSQIANDIAKALGWSAGQVAFRPVSGGSIGGSWELTGIHGRAFVKTMAASQSAMLDAERDGLERLARTGAIRTPEVLGYGSLAGSAWLALEWLDLRPLTGNASAALGRRLAEIHQCRAEAFGLEKDNFIGATPQPNTQTADWAEFFFEYRLGFQLALLARDHRGFGPEAADALRRAWEHRFSGYRPTPALLHGDFWGGNAAMLDDGEPVIFDPAVHYGDRECDLAMAEMFGGFGAAFHDAYRGVWPLEPEHAERRDFYQLYHLLNHANLFGGHYISASRRAIDQLAPDIA